MDHPYNILIEEKDMSDKIHARKVFDELYPKETFNDWRIKQAFAIAKLSNKNKEKMTSRRRKKKGRAATMGPKIN